MYKDALKNISIVFLIASMVVLLAASITYLRNKLSKTQIEDVRKQKKAAQERAIAAEKKAVYWEAYADSLMHIDAPEDSIFQVMKKEYYAKKTNDSVDIERIVRFWSGVPSN